MRQIVVNTNGITIRQLKEWLADAKEVDENGDDYGVWLETGDFTNSPVTEIWPLNIGDVELKRSGR